MREAHPYSLCALVNSKEHGSIEFNPNLYDRPSDVRWVGNLNEPDILPGCQMTNLQLFKSKVNESTHSSLLIRSLLPYDWTSSKSTIHPQWTFSNLYESVVWNQLSKLKIGLELIHWSIASSKSIATCLL